MNAELASATSPIVENDSLELPSELSEFLETNPRAVYTCKVYKIDLSSKKGTRELIDEWENEIPSVRDIGAENGAGTYEYWIRINAQGKKPRELKTYRVNLAARWDVIRDRYMAGQRVVGGTATAGSASGITMHDQLALMKDMISCFTPLFSANSGNQASPVALMTQLAEMQSKMLSSNFATNMDMQNKMMQTIEGARLSMLDSVDSGGGSGDTSDQIISEIMGILKASVPALLSVPRAAQNKITDTALASRPDIRKVIQNTAKRQKLVENIKSQFSAKQAEKIIEVVLGRITGKKKVSGVGGAVT